MRITSGILKDRLITLPAGSKVRPTTDKLRSSIFSILGERIKEAAVLDAFCGTGAFGIESYSRGAAEITFVDIDLAGVKTNLNLLPKDFPITVKKCDFVKTFRIERAAFDIIFIDPPYGVYTPEEILQKTAENNLLKEDGIIIYEEFFKTAFSTGDFFNIYDERKYGDTTIRLLEVSK